MSTLSLRLPDSLHRKLKELARQDGVSINQFIATAVAEKVSALSTADYLAQRAQEGSQEKFAEVLSKVPNVQPDPNDAMPSRD
jgi:predicted transcriptional regulator